MSEGIIVIFTIAYICASVSWAAIIISPANKVWRGGYLHESPCPSVCLSIGAIVSGPYLSHGVTLESLTLHKDCL